MATPPPSQNARPAILRLSDAVEHFMRAIFFRLGLFVAKRPSKVIIGSLIFLALSALGMFRFSFETRKDKLWIPVGSTTGKQRRWVNANFGHTSRLSSIVFVARNESTGIATKSAFLQMLKVAERGFKVTAGPLDEDGEFNTTITFEERCIRTSDAKSNSMCRTISAFNLFYDADNAILVDGKVDFFATVKNAIEKLSDAQIESTLKTPSNTFDNSPFIPDELYVKGENSDKYQVFLYTQVIENNAVEKNGNIADEEADELEEQWTDFVLDRANFNDTNDVDWYVHSVYGMNRDYDDALNKDLPYLALGFAMLGIYVIFFLGDWHAVRSHRLLGMAAIWTCIMAIITCFGLSSAVGMFFGPVHQILALLIIGIGADDCFHITRAADDMFQRADMTEHSVETRIALAMSQAGTSITVTTFTNLSVFLLSAISRLPALRYFAIWAAIGIFFAWVYAITFYTALVTYDVRRIQSKRLDCLPCLRPRENVAELNWFKQKPGAFSRFFAQRFGPFITGKAARFVILFMFLAAFGACIYGTSKLYLKFRFAYFYRSGSSQRNFQDVIDNYFELGDPTYIYVRNKPLKSVEEQARFLRLCDAEDGLIVTNEWIQNGSVTCWYHSMLQDNPPGESGSYEPDEFIDTVKNYISRSDSPGSRFATDIVFNDDETEIIGTRFEAKYVYRESNTDEVNGLQSVRRSANFDVEGLVSEEEGFGKDETGKLPAAFPYTFQDIDTEQYASLPTEIALSLGFASFAVAVVCFILVGHPTVAAISVVVVGFTIIDLLGLTYFSGINLNSISVCTLVLCTGISVDFVVHIMKAFLEHVGTRSERAIKALAQMGPPVFYAGFSTLLSVLALGLSASYVFRVVFLGFTFLIVLAFFHGLVLGPVILSMIGPPSFYGSEEEKESADNVLVKRFVGVKPAPQGTDSPSGTGPKKTHSSESNGDETGVNDGSSDS